MQSIKTGSSHHCDEPVFLCNKCNRMVRRCLTCGSGNINSINSININTCDIIININTCANRTNRG
ncbi:MAG: hypothetical protein J5506_03505 [Prevotella sp.]|nr:hypothetical protein [Prevotella sp.]